MRLDVLIERVAYNPVTGLFTWKDGKNKGKPALATLRPDGYLWGRIGDDYWLAHRAAWVIQTNQLPTYEVDHDDGNRQNNVFTNLFDRPHGQNCKNKAATSKGDLPPGVTYRPIQKNRPYVAKLGQNGKVYLGSFATVEEASKAYYDGLVRHGYSTRHGK